MMLSIAMLSSTSFSSTWLLEEELQVQVHPPIPVGWLDSRTTSRWLVDWNPGDPIFTARLCGFDIDPMMGTVTTWPQATIEAIPILQRPVRFDGQSFIAGPVVETIGDGDDDGDNNPGITIRVAHPKAGKGEVYLRQSNILSWTGQLQPDGSITGTVRYEPDQQMLGASTWWLRLGIRQRPSREKISTFSLTPLSVGTVCNNLP